MNWEKSAAAMRRHVEMREAITGHPVRPPCPGVGRLVRYYDVKGGRSACPVCGYEWQVSDLHDRDPSVFVYVADHYAKEQGR